MLGLGTVPAHHSRALEDLQRALLRFGVQPTMILEAVVVCRSELNEWLRKDKENSDAPSSAR